MPRHGTEYFLENKEEIYEELFDKRGINHITHYRTAKWPPLTPAVRSQFTTVKHVWKLGDKWWKLASEFYGDPKLWWVLAWYNEKPTESHVKQGNTIYVPQPIEKVISYFEYGSM